MRLMTLTNPDTRHTATVDMAEGKDGPPIFQVKVDGELRKNRLARAIAFTDAVDLLFGEGETTTHDIQHLDDR